MAAESRMASARRRANKEDGVDEDGADKALQNMEALGLEEADTSVQATAAATTGAAANEGEATSEATPENQGEQANAALESRADDVEDVAAQNERFNFFFEQVRTRPSTPFEIFQFDRSLDCFGITCSTKVVVPLAKKNKTLGRANYKIEVWPALPDSAKRLLRFVELAKPRKSNNFVID